MNDGNWHHVVLAAAADTQTMIWMGIRSVPRRRTWWRRVKLRDRGASVFGSYWPDNSYGDNVVGYFKGSIAEAANYRTQLGQADVKAQYQARLQLSGTPTKTVVVTTPPAVSSRIL